MKNRNNYCPVCGEQMDDNHFTPVSFPGIDEEICCLCDQNISLMFTNFGEKPGGGNGYIVPDNSDRLEQITGRSYLENRLIFYLYCLKKRQSEGNPPDAVVIEELEAEIEKITLAIKEGNS